MLVIRRRAGESIVIGEGIEIQVIEISGTRVKLGIQAPRQVPVVRKEVQLTAEENRTAAQAASPAALTRWAGLFHQQQES
jgi:carbon storage regulator